MTEFAWSCCPSMIVRWSRGVARLLRPQPWRRWCGSCAPTEHERAQMWPRSSAHGWCATRLHLRAARLARLERVRAIPRRNASMTAAPHASRNANAHRKWGCPKRSRVCALPLHADIGVSVCVHSARCDAWRGAATILHRSRACACAKNTVCTCAPGNIVWSTSYCLIASLNIIKRGVAAVKMPAANAAQRPSCGPHRQRDGRNSERRHINNQR